MKPTIALLRSLREDRKLKQSDVAKYLGTSQQHYSRYEIGATELPLRHFVKLAELYNVSADYLLGRATPLAEGALHNAYITYNCSCDALVNNILSLDEADRRAVVEYVEMQRIKEGIAILG